MTSSTPASNFLKGFTAALCIPLAALVLCHGSLELLARWAETKPGYYLWKDDDYLLLLDRPKFARPGTNRILIVGASEAVEGFVDRTISRRLPDTEIDNIAFDGAVLSDALLQLKYLERMYGSAAVPARIVVGISPRFLANVTMANQRRRFADAVNLYSPAGAPTEDAIAAKDNLHTALSWLRFRSQQAERYRSAVKAAWVELASRIAPGRLDRGGALEASLAKAKTRARRRASQRSLVRVLTDLDHWKTAHAWRASDHQALVDREFAELVAFAKRNRAQLFFVNVPEWPINKSLYLPGVYEDYLSTLERGRGPFPVLDLGDLLPDNEFIDSVHPTAAGAEKVSLVAADFIRAQEP